MLRSRLQLHQTLFVGLLLAAIAFVLVAGLSFLTQKPPVQTVTEKKDLIQGPNWEDYRNPDGTRTHVITTDAVRYYDPASSRWQPIDTAVRPAEGDFGYVNETNLAGAKFKASLDADMLFRYTLGGQQLTYGAPRLPNLSTARAVVKDNVVTYPDASPGVDLRYSIDAGRVLEEIVLNEPKDLASIEQVLRVEGLDVRSESDGRILFRESSSDQDLFEIPKPLLYEDGDRDKVSDGIRYAVRREGDHSVLTRTITPEGRAWLASATYPIVIDATTVTLLLSDSNQGEDMDVRDTTGGVTNDKRMAFLKFNISPSAGMPAGQFINSVAVSVYGQSHDSWDGDMTFWHVGNDGNFNDQSWVDYSPPTACGAWNAPVDTQVNQASGFSSGGLSYVNSVDIKDIFNVAYSIGRPYLTIRMADPDNYQATCPSSAATGNNLTIIVGDIIPLGGYHEFSSSENPPNLPKLLVNYTTFPNPPANFQTDAVTSAFRLSVRWTDNTTDEDGFYLRIGDNSSSSNETYDISTGTSGSSVNATWNCTGTSKAGTGGTCTFTRTGLNPSTTKYFWVSSNKLDPGPGIAESTRLGPINATTFSFLPGSVTLQPANSAVYNPTLLSDRLIVTWTDSTVEEASWKVYHSTDGSTWSQIGTVNSTTVGGTGTTYTYTHSGLAPNTIHYYRVSAVSNSPVYESPLTATTPVSGYTLAEKYASTPTLTANPLGANLEIIRPDFGTTQPSNGNGSNPASTAYRVRITDGAYTYSGGDSGGGCSGACSPVTITAYDYDLGQISGSSLQYTPSQGSCVGYAAPSAAYPAVWTTLSTYNRCDINQPLANGFDLDGCTGNAGNTCGGSTAITDDLFPNTKYTFKVMARNAESVESNYSTAFSRWTLALAPTTPTLIGTATTTGFRPRININTSTRWSINPDVTEYAIFVTRGASTFYVQANGSLGASAVWQTRDTWDGATNDKAATLTNLTPNTQYQVQTKARNGDSPQVETGLSAAGTFYTLANPPGTLTVTGQSTSQLLVAWPSNSNPDATTYQIEYSTAPTFTSPVTSGDQNNLCGPPAGLPSGSCSFTIGSLAPNSGYYVRVRAKNADGSGYTSYTCNGVGGCASPSAAYTLADPPINFGVDCGIQPPYHCVLSWNPPATPPGNAPPRYSIYRSTVASGNCPALTSYKTWANNITGTSFDDTGLLANQKYCYNMGGYNTAQVDSLTRTATLSDVTQPAQVTNLSHTSNTTTTITWLWKSVSGADGYKVYNADSGQLIADQVEVNQTLDCSIEIGLDLYCSWTQSDTDGGALLTPNTRYHIKVSAVSNLNGEGQTSDPASPASRAYTSIESPSPAGVEFGAPGGTCGSGLGCITGSQVEARAAGSFSHLGDGTAPAAGTLVHETQPSVKDFPLSSTNAWQQESALNLNARVCVQAKAKNGDGEWNPTSGYVPGTAACKYSLSTTPSVPSLRVPTGGQMEVTQEPPDNNDSASNPVEYAYVVSEDGGPFDRCLKAAGGSVTLAPCQLLAESGQPNQRLYDQQGTPQPLTTEFWNLKAEWDVADGSPPVGGGKIIFTATGLTPGKTYSVVARTRNGDLVESASSLSSEVFLVKNNVVGWLWSSNAGWISMNCLNFKDPTKDLSPSVYKCDSENDFYGVNIDFLSARPANPLSGNAWSPQVGWISFNYDEATNNGVDVPTGFVSPCAPSNCLASANGTTREVTGWARVMGEKAAGEAAVPAKPDWGWIKLKGTWNDGGGNTGPYLWSLADIGQMEFLNIASAGSVSLYSVFGWAWDESTTAGSVGYGWIQARSEGNIVNVPYLQTFYRDIYSGKDVRLAPPPGGLTQCGPAGDQLCTTATYLILANGAIQGIAGFYQETSTGKPTSSLQTTQPVFPSVAEGYSQLLGPNAVNKIDVTSLTTFVGSPQTVGDHEEGTDRYGHALWKYPQGLDKTASNLWSAYPADLGAKVYHIRGDFTLNDPNSGNSVLDPIEFSNKGGSGTVVVDGDLHVRTNVGYRTGAGFVPTKLTELGSLGFIVRGNVYIDPAVSSLVGAYVAVGDQAASYGICSGGTFPGTACTSSSQCTGGGTCNSVYDHGELFTASRAYRPPTSAQSDVETFGAGASDWEAANATSLNYGCIEKPASTYKSHRSYLRFPLDVPKQVCSLEIEKTCPTSCTGNTCNLGTGTCVVSGTACTSDAECPTNSCVDSAVSSVVVRVKTATGTSTPVNSEIDLLDTNNGTSNVIDPAGSGAYASNPQANSAYALVTPQTFSAKVCENDPFRLCSTATDCIGDALTPSPTCGNWIAGGRYQSGNAAAGLETFINGAGATYAPDQAVGIVLKQPDSALCDGSHLQSGTFRSSEGGGVYAKDAPQLIMSYNVAGQRLEINGLLIARRLHFERQFVTNLQPAESVVYDGRAVSNTPPGLEDFAKALPTYQQVVP